MSDAYGNSAADESVTRYAGSVSFAELVERFSESHVEAIVLMGSYARDDAGPYSDVDLVRFLAATWRGTSDAQSYVIGDQLVVVSTVVPERVEESFTIPKRARWSGVVTTLWKNRRISCYSSRLHSGGPRLPVIRLQPRR